MARHAQLLDRLSLIEARLDQLEERLSATAQRGTTSSEGIAETTPGSPVTDLTALFDLGSLIAPPTAPPTTPTFIARSELITENSDESSPIQESLERIIGGRWYAVLGGLVVIIGVAFFYQYAVQQGWFRILPPWAKCGAGGLFGAALLIAAELIRRRVNAWAAVGLSAAGIGSMYVSAYAAYAKYGLVTSPTAFVMLSLCAGIGIVFAARARLVAVAIVSLIGGYLTPLLLHNSGAAAALPPYWLMLLSVGLILSGRLAGSFVHLRWMTYWATIIFCGLWVLGPGDRYPLIAIATLGFAWCAIHAELWWSASRECRANESDESEPSDSELNLPAFLRPPAWSPLVSSFCITAWAVGLGVIHARGWGRIPDWMPAAGGAAATGLAALVLAGNLRVLRDRPRTAAERLGAGLTAQAGALLIAAVALALTGRLEVISWLGMGVAAIFAGRWIGSRAVGVYGAFLLAIATSRLVSYDAAFSTMPAPLFTNLGLVFSWWMILVVAAAICWMIVARLIQAWPIGASDADDDVRREDVGEVIRAMSAGVSGLSVALLLISFLHPDASTMSITLVWMALGGLAMACSRLAPAFRLDLHSAWITLVSLIVWSVAFVAPGWSHNTDAPGLHRGLIIALALAAQFIIIFRAFADRLAAIDSADDRVGPVRTAGIVIATLLVFAASSFEVSRAAGILFTDRTGRLAAVSIWWGLFALALLAVGFLRKTSTSQAARRAGLALLGLATAKALFLDTSQVSLGWRVISVLGLGLLMLGVGVAYARLSRRSTEASGPLPTRGQPAAIGNA